MASKNYFLSGITELLILKILKQGDSYVYDITKKIHELSNGSLSISQNTIYAATYKLELDKKVSEYSKLVGRKKTRIYYHIEETGLIALEQLSKTYYDTTNAVNDILKLLSQNI